MVSVTKESARAEHVAMTETFARRSAALGLNPDPLLFWYHTIDLGDGLVTPGTFDYRASLAEFRFPDDMSGMSALDVGSASGFFAFELERRGAAVTSIEIPALDRWDHFPGESEHAIVNKIRDLLPYHSVLPSDVIERTFRTLTAQQLHHMLLDGPFEFCRRVLHSRVERAFGAVYDLPQVLGDTRRFDVVLLGDILLHTIDPLRALVAASRVCGGTLMIVQEMGSTSDDRPAVLYVGGDTPDADVAQWWRPNLPWFRHVLKRVGFDDIECMGNVRGFLRPGAEPFDKTVIHAHRSQ
jgi:tRNA (mo5U34)-methyltransferase